MTAKLGRFLLGTTRLSNTTTYPYSIYSEMRRLQDSQPLTKVEYVSPAGVTTDITAYYLSGANFDQIKERAPDEIQAGTFDVVLANQTDYFSEFVPDSLFYNDPYHGGKIKIYEGFRLPDGTTSYVIQAVGFIDELDAAETESTVTLRCRDRIRILLDRKVHPRPSTEVAVADPTNIGNGLMSTVNTKPFKTKNELWTLTCTLAGADGVATFSVIGATSGNIGTATSGTTFSSTSAGGVRFTISGGSINWALGDKFTFTTKQYPEWSAVNAGKIIWSILTGYNYDSNTAEAWSGQVLALDHTQSDANTDIDYDSFVTAIADIASIASFNLTGYIAYDETAADVIQSLILLFQGSVFTGGDGRIKIKVYVPNSLGTANVVAYFSDAKKITQLGYVTSIDEVINYVSVHYKKTNVWQFSDDEVIYDGNYVATDTDSITRYDYLTEGFSSRWYSTNGAHAQDFADRLVGKYAVPPLNIDFVTGLDAMLVEIGEVVEVTDSKYHLSAERGEISKITKNFDSRPAQISLRVRRDSDFGITYGFLASEANEGDGISPQSDNFDTASATDLTHCYIGKIGQVAPDYRMF